MAERRSLSNQNSTLLSAPLISANINNNSSYNFGQTSQQFSEIPKHTRKDTLKNLDDMNVKFIFAFTIMAVVAIIVFFGIGIAVFHNWWGFDRLDAAYFAVITFSTVGYVYIIFFPSSS
jgi:hypothetical protein